MRRLIAGLIVFIFITGIDGTAYILILAPISIIILGSNSCGMKFPLFRIINDLKFLKVAGGNI